MKKISWQRIFFCYFLFYFLLTPLFLLYAHSKQEFPVLYQGRFRPAEAYARLWLYEIYHAQALKNNHATSFSLTSPLSLLWSIQTLGYHSHKDIPLFWIGSAQVKQLLDLPVNQNRFSYEEITQALYHNNKTSRAIFQRLVIYHVLKKLQENAQLSPFSKIEISSLLPGLWVQRHGEHLRVMEIPAHSPWSFLKIGQDIASIQRPEGEILQQDRKLIENFSFLFKILKDVEKVSNPLLPMEKALKERLKQLQAKGIPSKEIASILEQEYPLLQRLRAAGSLFQALPGKYQEGEWFSLQAFNVQMYHSPSNTLKPVGNFTLFSDASFEAVKEAYRQLEKTFTSPINFAEQQKSQEHLNLTLQQAYQTLSGTIYQQAHGKQLSYPSLLQLKIETFYVSYPWIPLLILGYGLGGSLLIISSRLPWKLGCSGAIGIISLAFLFHTLLLIMRCYILERPPVSNMFETVIYVPWIAMFISLILPSFRRQSLVLLAACLISIILLLILEMTNLNQSLDQVQAVLDSQFWLMIHVLLVVGSYGVFILGAVLGHFYLGLFLKHRRETPRMLILGHLILQTLYLGTILLIVGTILGGIWAAESWGRFWDWDPKESWAFISSCFYLIWIHAYRFHRIAFFGLSVGAIIGLLAISFTWYGVNYILGTGLHSYGFGSGGESYYYIFLGVESLFLMIVLKIQVLVNPSFRFELD